MGGLARGVVAGLLLGMAGTAQAQTAEGWYVGAEAGLNWLRDATTAGGTESYKAEYDNGPAVIGQAGYGFKPMGVVRPKLEGELGWRRNSVSSVSGGAGSGDAQSTSLMANVVGEFLPESKIHPFLGVGLGGARVNSDATGTSGGYSGDDTVLAYQAMAGVGLDVAKDVGLKLAYRYFATDDPTLGTTGGASASSEYGSHALTAGVTFRFGGGSSPAPREAAMPQPEPVRPVAAPLAKPAEPQRLFRVLFDWNTAALTPDGEAEIMRAAVAAKSGGNARVDLSGHADRSGPEGYNMKLSLQRAKAVKDALIVQGVPADAITVVGKGEKEPTIATMDGVREGQNRRVEIVLP